MDNVVEIRGLMKRLINLLADKDAQLSDAEVELAAANKAIVALADCVDMRRKWGTCQTVLTTHAQTIKRARGE